MPISVAAIEAKLRQEPTRTNERGNAVYHWFGSADRYVVDFAEDRQEQGWEQFDTDQDACYFGLWVNWAKLMTLSYAEGDWYLVVCPDREHYLAEIQSAIEFYGEGRIAAVFDLNAHTETVYRQDRSAFLREPVLV